MLIALFIEQCKYVNSAKKACNSCFANIAFPENRWDPVNNKLLFFVTKRLQLRFKKNIAAAAEPNGL
jgi:hypothetical protein